MTAAWPGTVNQFMLRDPYSEQMEDNKSSFKPDVGPPIERTRTSISHDIITGEGRGTLTEWTALKAFYRTTLSSGVLPFTRTDPQTGATITCTFIAPPVLTRIGAIYRHYSLQFRVLG
jgi:hypothetical protein